MKKEENLEVEGLTFLQKDEMKTLDGGVLASAVAITVVAGLVVSFVDNFGDFKEGLSDGANGRNPRY